MRSTLVWYGERGIVNAFVTGIVRAAETHGVQAFRDVLLDIRWADGGQPDWLERVEAISAIVEVGLYEFGDPDLILVRLSDTTIVQCPTVMESLPEDSTAASTVRFH